VRSLSARGEVAATHVDTGPPGKTRGATDAREKAFAGSDLDTTEAESAHVSKKRGSRKTTQRHRSRRRRTLRIVARGPQTPEQTAKGLFEKQRADFEARRQASIARAAFELDHVDATILGLLLQQPQLTQEQIGQIVGLGREAVNVRINAAKFQRAIHEANRSAIEVLDKNKAHAARVLGRLLDSKDERVQIRAAIAHLWPHIHAEGGGGMGSDLVSLIQEAYELAQADKQQPGPQSR